ALGIERRKLAHVRGEPDVVFGSRPREDAPVPAAARRVDAIEEIDAAVDAGNEIAHGADAHQIARLAGGEERGRGARDPIHLLARLSDREPADRVPREIE